MRLGGRVLYRLKDLVYILTINKVLGVLETARKRDTFAPDLLKGFRAEIAKLSG